MAGGPGRPGGRLGPSNRDLGPGYQAPSAECLDYGDAEAASAAAAAPAAFASRAEVDAALASAFGYFAASEPTSPALLLIRQAREMLGKNLYEVMKLLAPPHADAARVFVGPDGAFTVPVKSLSNAPSAAIQSAPAEPAASTNTDPRPTTKRTRR